MKKLTLKKTKNLFSTKELIKELNQLSNTEKEKLKDIDTLNDYLLTNYYSYYMKIINPLKYNIINGDITFLKALRKKIN